MTQQAILLASLHFLGTDLNPVHDMLHKNFHLRLNVSMLGVLNIYEIECRHAGSVDN